jgi:hypothetical protein
MRRFFKHACRPCLFVLMSGIGEAQEYPDTGTSFNPLFEYRINEHWYLSSINNYATKNGADDFSIAYVDLTLGRQLNKNWSVDAGYRHAWIDLIGETREERRPLINLKRKDFPGGWFILNRARIEWRNFEDDRFEDRFRYRQQLLSVFPWKITGTRAQCYIEEEFFYEFTGSGFNMNWLTTGLRHPLTDDLSLKVGYRWQRQKIQKNWETRHVLVTGVVVKL